jgi:hypothetical protein
LKHCASLAFEPSVAGNGSAPENFNRRRLKGVSLSSDRVRQRDDPRRVGFQSAVIKTEMAKLMMCGSYHLHANDDTRDTTRSTCWMVSRANMYLMRYQLNLLSGFALMLDLYVATPT